MSLEYRKFTTTVDQQDPIGSLCYPLWPDLDSRVWSGEAGTFPEQDYPSTILTIPQVAKFYGDILAPRTRGYINIYMPEWRLNRWRRWYDIREKVKVNQTLSPIEQSEYDCFPDPTETQEICDTYVGPVLQWVVDVINEHNRIAFGMYAQTTFEDLLALYNSLSYPPFILS